MSNRIRDERIRRGWSQTRLAALTEIAAQDISAIERGVQAAYPGWRRRLVGVFGIPEAELFATAADENEVGSGDGV